MDEALHPRAAVLIEKLGLTAHPEGGAFSEVYRSSATVLPVDGRGERRALTVIYFLLTAHQIGAWHRVGSDEVWHYYEGDPLELTWIDGEANEIRTHILGPVGDGQRPVAVVPSGSWQTARPTGVYTLVGCTVGPGFEYEDWEALSLGVASA